MNAATIDQKIQSCICCIVVFSGRPTPPRTHYKAFRVSSLAQQLLQLGDIRRDPPRVVAREQLGCHASLIFGVWLICTIQGPKDFRASMCARHGPQAVLRPAADGDGARILVRSARAARRRRAREGLVR